MDSNGAIKQTARAGLGVSLQHRAATALELEHGMLGAISVREPLPRRQWFVLWPSVGPQPGPVSEFVEFVTTKEAKKLVERFWLSGETSRRRPAAAKATAAA
jgi:DNA-binding transcriptional LysR family regulator